MAISWNEVTVEQVRYLPAIKPAVEPGNVIWRPAAGDSIHRCGG